MKKLSVIRLAKYRNCSDWHQQGLLASELELLLPPGNPDKAPAADHHPNKKKKPTKSSKQS